MAQSTATITPSVGKGIAVGGGIEQGGNGGGKYAAFSSRVLAESGPSLGAKTARYGEKLTVLSTGITPPKEGLRLPGFEQKPTVSPERQHSPTSMKSPSQAEQNPAAVNLPDTNTQPEISSVKPNVIIKTTGRYGLPPETKQEEQQVSTKLREQEIVKQIHQAYEGNAPQSVQAEVRPQPQPAPEINSPTVTAIETVNQQNVNALDAAAENTQTAAKNYASLTISENHLQRAEEIRAELKKIPHVPFSVSTDTSETTGIPTIQLSEKGNTDLEGKKGIKNAAAYLHMLEKKHSLKVEPEVEEEIDSRQRKPDYNDLVVKIDALKNRASGLLKKVVSSQTPDVQPEPLKITQTDSIVKVTELASTAEHLANAVSVQRGVLTEDTALSQPSASISELTRQATIVNAEIIDQGKIVSPIRQDEEKPDDDANKKTILSVDENAALERVKKVVEAASVVAMTDDPNEVVDGYDVAKYVDFDQKTYSEALKEVPNAVIDGTLQPAHKELANSGRYPRSSAPEVMQRITADKPPVAVRPWIRRATIANLRLVLNGSGEVLTKAA